MREPKGLLKRFYQDCGGQMAIFMALIFQVLFVFFAMSINVALVVHDKINLQNAVDLAVYYAASKQAEILNAIAHQNYQIRQAYKLLAFRQNVIGTLGLEGPPSPAWTGASADDRWLPLGTPVICVSHPRGFYNNNPDETLCNKPATNIPAPPKVIPAISGFSPINALIQGASIQRYDDFNGKCSDFGSLNWFFAAAALTAFRMEQAHRKKIIYALAENLSNMKDNGDFFDIDGTSVFQGARKVFMKNLTYSNANGNPSFELFNSVGKISPRDQWLRQIPIFLTANYMDRKATEGCVGEPKNVSNKPNDGLSGEVVGWGAEKLLPFVGGEDYRNDDYFGTTMGVEKNPWIHVYAGVKATTQTRQIFFPWGEGIRLRARGFAKPFGGTIGPWYSSRWSKGGQQSEGGSPRIDTVGPCRYLGGETSACPLDIIPNTSRYPGDTLGARSQAYASSLGKIGGLTGNKAYYAGYSNTFLVFQQGGLNSSLYMGSEGDSDALMRQLEIAAVAPDLFDITYYSIEPDWVSNYGNRIKKGGNKALSHLVPDVFVVGDLGSFGDREFTVADQLKVAVAMGRRGYWNIDNDKQHVLTSWAHHDDPVARAFDFKPGFFPKNFAKCISSDYADAKNPGSCVQGGRTGYSVKLVSRRFLKEASLNLGNGSEGPIENPPPSGW